MPVLSPKMDIVFDTHEYRLSEIEEQDLHDKLSGLATQVEKFPFAKLRAYIQGVRSNQIVVKLTLLLPGRTLTVDDYDVVLQPAFDRCLNSLLHELDGYKDQLNHMSDAAKLEEGTHQQFSPATIVDAQELESAVADRDYAAFHRVLLPVEEELRMRVGRWVQRYPDVNDVIGDSIEIADIVEETQLLAFENYTHRPRNVPLGDWLESLIDPAIKALANHRDEEMANIAAVRTERDAVEGRTRPSEML